MNATLLGIECSDGEACECCGTPCPRRRVVIQTVGGDIRRLGSTCAALALRPSEARKIVGATDTFVRQEKAIAEARRHLANGVALRAVANRLGCFCRYEIRNGAIVVIRNVLGQWVETPVVA